MLNILIQGLQDPHQSVREAVGLSLGYCSEHLKPEIMDFHQLILPPIINLIPNSPNNVKTKALYAIDTFCEFFDEDIEPYLPTLVPTLVNLVINDEMKIKQMALSALTSAISSAENKISPYYNDMIQLLGKILES